MVRHAFQSLELLMDKNEEISRGVRGIPLPPILRKILKSCAIYSCFSLHSQIYHLNFHRKKVSTKKKFPRFLIFISVKKCSTLKFMTNISFVPSVCIHRSIILIFIEKKYACRFFSTKKKFPRFLIFISVRIFVSATNSRLW